MLSADSSARAMNPPSGFGSIRYRNFVVIALSSTIPPSAFTSLTEEPEARELRRERTQSAHSECRDSSLVLRWAPPNSSGRGALCWMQDRVINSAGLAVPVLAQRRGAMPVSVISQTVDSHLVSVLTAALRQSS